MAKLSDFIDQDVIDDYLENDPDIFAGKMELATMFVEDAKSIAPEDQGTYIDGIRVRRFGKTGVGIEFSDPKSNIIEYGSEDTPEFAVMRRTMERYSGGGQ